MSGTVFAHTKEGESAESWQMLADHLRGVAELAGGFAGSFGYRNWGYALGLLHDAGKVDPAFQRRLFQANAPSFDHAAYGAAVASERYEKDNPANPTGFDIAGNMLAFAVAGHHGGMPNGTVADGGETLTKRVSWAKTLQDSDCYLEVLKEAGLVLPTEEDLEPLFPLSEIQPLLVSHSQEAIDRMIFSVPVRTRMLYSCLVDADYLDTESFTNLDNANKRESQEQPSLPELLTRLEQHMNELTLKTDVSRVNEGRALVLADCKFASELPPGLFNLTVPTGGGKTLASLNFALRHAIKNNMRRVIYAIPFTSIVEQTAGVFRETLDEKGAGSPSCVLEHHSNYDFDALDSEQALRERLAVQNWDAPIIVTTNVQLLESLFSNKPSKCRKLHNIANSVIVLDEAQTLPNELLTVSLAMLEELTNSYNVSVVLCTATQPALDDLWPFGSKPHEIVKDQLALKEHFKSRAEFVVDGQVEEGILAEKLSELDQILCIVSTRAHARDLYRDVCRCCRESGLLHGKEPYQEGIFHLSANMTPYHRSLWLQKIRARLDDGERCIVISTQLIEAGVDVDFPVVYREMAGLDSLVQAAGRCNREGRNDVPGIVHVFDFADAEDAVPGSGTLATNWLGLTAKISRELIERHSGHISADMTEEYFQWLHGVSSEKDAHTGRQILDATGLYKDLCNRELPASRFSTMDFQGYADKYKIIDDKETPVFVPWGEEGRKLYFELECSCHEGMPPSAMARTLQRFSVGIPNWKYSQYKEQMFVDDKTYAPIRVLCQEENCMKQYDDEVGILEVGEGTPNDLII